MIQVIDNKALLIQTNIPANITQIIPEAEILRIEQDVSTLLLKWSLDNVRILRNLGYRAPTPILGQYNWPGLFTPKIYQKITSDFLTAHSRAFCLNEQGTGKTASCIWALDYLMHQKHIKRVLVICPLSVIAVWQQELFNLVMHRTVTVAYGTKQQRVAAIQSNSEFVLINVDGVQLMQSELMHAKFDMVLIDEFTAIKNKSTERWKAVNTLITPDTRSWLLSGTPAPQGPQDAYGPIKLICPNQVPKYFAAWREATMIKRGGFRWEPKSDAMEQVYAAMQPAIRFEKRQCIDLPPITYQTLDVELSAMQKKYYAQMKKQLQITVQDTKITAVNAISVLTKLFQIALGAVKTDVPDEVMQFDITPRLNVVRDIIDGASHKVIIAVPYINALKTLHTALSAHYTCEIVYGDVSRSNREKIFHKFQTTPDPHILIMQPNAVAHGITLTEANTIIWFGPTTSFNIYEQFNARMDRLGQINKMTVYLLQGCQVERDWNRNIKANSLNHSTLVQMFHHELLN